MSSPSVCPAYERCDCVRSPTNGRSEWAMQPGHSPSGGDTLRKTDGSYPVVNRYIIVEKVYAEQIIMRPSYGQLRASPAFKRNFTAMAIGNRVGGFVHVL